MLNYYYKKNIVLIVLLLIILNYPILAAVTGNILDVKAVLPTDYSHGFRRPYLLEMNNNLYLFWEQPVKQILSDNSEVDASDIDSYVSKKLIVKEIKNPKLEYIILSKNELEIKVPIKKSQGNIELQSSYRIYPFYSLLINDNNLMLTYESYLKKNIGISSLSFITVEFTDNNISVGKNWSIPKSDTLYLDKEDFERLKARGITDEKLIEYYGMPSKTEINSSNESPVIIKDEKTNQIYCVGNTKYTLKNGNIWLRKSIDNGITWSEQQIIGRGQFPSLSIKNNEIFLIATEFNKKMMESGYKQLGVWPDEEDNNNTWQIFGRIIVWHWKLGDKIPDKSDVIINEPTTIESKLIIRKDGLMAIVL